MPGSLRRIRETLIGAKVLAWVRSLIWKAEATVSPTLETQILPGAPLPLPVIIPKKDSGRHKGIIELQGLSARKYGTSMAPNAPEEPGEADTFGPSEEGDDQASALPETAALLTPPSTVTPDAPPSPIARPTGLQDFSIVSETADANKPRSNSISSGRKIIR